MLKKRLNKRYDAIIYMASEVYNQCLGNLTVNHRLSHFSNSDTRHTVLL